MVDQAVHTGGPVPAAGSGPGAGADGFAADGFTGRRRELDRLRADAGRGPDALSGRPVPRGRVLLVAGRPGSGRTALAEEFVRRVAADHPGGVLRARLTGPDGTPVPAEDTARDLLGALRRPVPAGAGEEELTGELRAVLGDGRRVLLLDGVTGPGQLAGLLPDNPDCLVLAVSGGPLTGVRGVRPCTLGGLDTGSAVALLARCAGDDLRFTVDPRAAEELAEACGGLPAALVLAGGWLAAHPMASVAEALRRLAELPDGLLPGAVPGGETGAGVPGGSGGSPARTADGPVPARVPRPGRRRTVPAHPLVRAFRLVYDSLPPSAARLLRLLALAPAGLVDAHVAAALAGCPPRTAGAALEHLARLGLLRPATGPGPAAVFRHYTVPDCLHPLLAALLAAGECAAEARLARARLLERTVRLLGSCRAAAEPPGSPARARAAGLPRALRFDTRAEAAAWLDSRLPALRAAARLAAADGELDALARRPAVALAAALRAHRGAEGSAAERYRLHELLLPVTGRRGLHGERAAALLDLGDLDSGAGRPRRALERYRAALDAARALGGQDGGAFAVRAMESLGDVHAVLGDRQRAADWYGRALALCQTGGDLADEARLYARIGDGHRRAERWEEALRAWRAAAAVCRRLGDEEGCARALAEAERARKRADGGGG
ncbi:hypothetical protein V1L54_28175 [Streptomyces sp. TRM 70361]|uniref:hypothetical protein n=1 Tax=Streptomyces sp. TRM 70361 TaxID=3116553 RepID=UPI002E7B413B|nr:hypothetical protein [Streptomyces sp. TRM 70361]MEE1943235.1 hypothetical protein [Streptomyces sp. TRM 70361]